MVREIGLVGVGKIGEPIAQHLLQAGYRLHVFDARHDAVKAVAASGAIVAASTVDLASRVETVLVSLPTPEVVRHVALGPDGIAGGTKVRIYIDLSTSGPRVAAEVAEALARKNIAAIDAPVSGGVAGARKGTLAIMVSGPAALFASLRPMLEAFGRCFHVGERPGMGQIMKIANNMLSATAMAASAEVMVMGVKAGLDPRIMIDVINAGTGANTAIRDKFPKAILTRKFDWGFATGLMHKDVRLCLEVARELGTRMPVSQAVGAIWSEAEARFGQESDFTRIAQLAEQWAGIEIKAPES